MQIFGYCVYQIYFHPLSKYPGPLSSKLTSFRAAYHAWTEDQHLDIWRCHQKYGPIVRYRPDYVSFNTVEAYKDIYSGDTTTKPRVYEHLQRQHASILTLRDNKAHTVRRRLLGHGLTSTAVTDMEPRMLRHVRNFCHALGAGLDTTSSEKGAWGSPLEMADWCSYLTFDIMVDIVFGVSGNLLVDPSQRSIVEDIGISSKRAFVLINAPLLYLGRMDRKLFPGSVSSRRRFLRLVDELVARSTSLSAEEKSRAIVHRLLAGRDAEANGGIPVMQSLVSDATTLTVAGMLGHHFSTNLALINHTTTGFDTTAPALSATFFYLSRSPSIYNRLVTEIRQRFSSPDEIKQGELLNSCTYLRACIDETLRITPPVATALFREVLPGGELIDGHVVPAGYHAGTSAYSIHHRVDYFHLPKEYIPERWLNPSGTRGGVHNPAAYIPFLRGPRSCLGRSLAYWELLVTVAMVLWEFDFRAVDGSEAGVGGGDSMSSMPGRNNSGEYQLFDRGTCGRVGPVLQFRRRI
ncbi:cytochrome P450 [Aspergillus campestris IBT 28561]|uniref:Cytochrome P450 n=1 Tax=Aspergillus campestris (strain IBT 28561) TaxID=1392248 RepID=A0A2I1D2G3_ASPC2|nr:cytochrome P450 [Aspergillus campestris IBT 28561]PKY04082.1 cytochrome P450 [Aspergillus campestris IBT 28561]